MKQRWSRLALAVGAMTISAAASAGPSAAMLSNACSGCHGTHGGSAGPSMPSLASQSKTAIVEAMKKFKSGDRPSSIMGRIAKGYTDEQIELMGDFFAKQKFHATSQMVDAAMVKHGASLQESNCSRCHLDEGKDGKDDTPVMASQWLPYLQMQMDLYQSGARKMPEKMAEKVKPLSKHDLEALLHFYASQK
ncbi:MAG: c-type cytochrome [Gammaproteobacteria bacterium]|nr:c-type cytochrome [Gammaproteobacteria bacterium]MBU1416777.1 c-type cytochrome [Gammaproteobacteria bacterium]